MKSLTLRVTDEEHHRVKQQARRAHLTVTGFLRTQLGIEKHGKGRTSVSIVRSAGTGAPAFASKGGLPTLSTAAVAEMLTDFP
jgi:hypothetical protein